MPPSTNVRLHEMTPNFKKERVIIYIFFPQFLPPPLKTSEYKCILNIYLVYSVIFSVLSDITQKMIYNQQTNTYTHTHTDEFRESVYKDIPTERW